MPKVNADLVAKYTRKKKEKDEKAKAGGEASTSQPAQVGPRITESDPPLSTAEVEAPTPISVILPEELQPRKSARPAPGAPSAPAPGNQEPSKVFAGIENFSVADPGTTVIAANTATLMIRSRQKFATSVGGRAVEEKEALHVEIGNLKKATSELKKTTIDEAAAHKNAEEELGKSNTEVTRLRGELSKLKESVTSLEKEKNDLKLKAAEDLSKAEGRIQDLKNELEEMTEECIRAYEGGYNQCVEHIKFLYSDIDTSELGCTKKMEDGKLIDAAH